MPTLQRDRWMASDPTIPADRAILIGVGGQAADHMNLGLDLNYFTRQPDITGAIHERPPQGALGLKIDDDHLRVFTPEVMFEVLFDPPVHLPLPTIMIAPERNGLIGIEFSIPL